MKISKDRLKNIIMQEVRNIMETKKGKDKKTGRPDDEAFVADKGQEEVEGGKETGEEAFTTKKGMKKKTGKGRAYTEEKNEGRRITRSALMNIIREEMQSLREEEEEGGPDRDWRVSYSYPLLNGKSQPATASKVVAPTPEAARKEAAKQAKEKVENDPNAAGPATNFAAHEN